MKMTLLYSMRVAFTLYSADIKGSIKLNALVCGVCGNTLMSAIVYAYINTQSRAHIHTPKDK